MKKEDETKDIKKEGENSDEEFQDDLYVERIRIENLDFRL